MATDQRLNNSVLKWYRPEKARNQAISQIASGFYCVEQEQRIEEVAAELTKLEDVTAVGVTDASGRVTGTIVRNDFFTLLGRPYGRDVLRNLAVREVMTTGPSFKADTNLFSIAEELSTYLQSADISFFPLRDENGGFCGIFSTHDLLLHLSNMTQNDIALARKLQSRIVRERDLVAGESFEFTSYSSTAKGVGGDFYSLLKYDVGKWVLAVCDVSGKGVAASIVTSVIWGMMSIFDFRRGVRPFIQKLNDYVVQTFESEKFVTGLFVSLDESTGEARICDMGHSHIFLFRNGRLLKVTTGQNNLPIGVVPDISPRVSRFVPETGDILMVITDGLIEQENMAGETYEIKRVSAILEKTSDLPVESINDALIEDFERFRGNHHLNDDVTYGIVKFTPQEVVL